jgi:hypothetical protein
VRASRRRDQPGQAQGARWGGRSSEPFFEGAADALTATLDPGLVGPHRGQCAAPPGGIEGARLEGGVIAEAMEGRFQRAGHCRRSPRARALAYALGALAGKAINPRPQGGIRQLERVRDGVEALSFHDVAHGLGTAKDASVLGLLYDGV